MGRSENGSLAPGPAPMFSGPGRAQCIHAGYKIDGKRIENARHLFNYPTFPGLKSPAELVRRSSHGGWRVSLSPFKIHRFWKRGGKFQPPIPPILLPSMTRCGCASETLSSDTARQSTGQIREDHPPCPCQRSKTTGMCGIPHCSKQLSDRINYMGETFVTGPKDWIPLALVTVGHCSVF